MIIPHLVASNAAEAIEFYKKAFGATEVMRMPEQNGTRLMHVELTIGDARVFLCDDFPEYCGGASRTVKAIGGVPMTLHIDVPNCDAAIDKAVAAGAKVKMPPADMFWGDRYGQITDPYGYDWSFAHPLKK